MEHNGRGKPPRLSQIYQNYDPPLYFVTLCTADRKRLLDNRTVHEAFLHYARRGHEEKGIAVGRFVIMPDHIHLFIRLPSDYRLDQWVRMLKVHLGREIRKAKAEREIWERGFFDHVIRNSESYGSKWMYVRQNPVRAKLVLKSDDWPYQGEVILIDRA